MVISSSTTVKLYHTYGRLSSNARRCNYRCFRKRVSHIEQHRASTSLYTSYLVIFVAIHHCQYHVFSDCSHYVLLLRTVRNYVYSYFHLVLFTFYSHLSQLRCYLMNVTGTLVIRILIICVFFRTLTFRGHFL